MPATTPACFISLACVESASAVACCAGCGSLLQEGSGGIVFAPPGRLVFPRGGWGAPAPFSGGRRRQKGGGRWRPAPPQSPPPPPLPPPASSPAPPRSFYTSSSRPV